MFKNSAKSNLIQFDQKIILDTIARKQLLRRQAFVASAPKGAPQKSLAEIKNEISELKKTLQNQSSLINILQKNAGEGKK